jgi:hypothetical protein
VGILGKSGKRAEREIESYKFPDTVGSGLDPRPSKGEMALVYRGLREWFICWAYRHHHQLWLPSRAVDGAWLAFMTDEAAYLDFCDRAFGRGLEHDRDPLRDDSGRAMFETVYAWDRSGAAKRADSVLWSLDEQLQVESPLGIGAEALAQIRSNDDPRYGGPYMYGADTGGVTF